ncbi:MAG: YihY/virulence factor BrkB family protein [gamma proteobacterium symbiont of Bathyaustriella thionipta]|nr:YihY/virulence factor BrkB family protein [gamma proteobacterium symbiont of Bathyaustriella thionipta]
MLHKINKKGIDAFIWEVDIKGFAYWKRFGFSLLRMFYLIVRDILDGQLTLRVMSLVYTTLLSIVPLIAVSFSVLKGFGVHNQVEPLLMKMLSGPLGSQGAEITEKIIGFVDNMKIGVLGSVGLALLLYTVVSLVQKIERSFNYTWHVSEHRPFAQRFSDYLSVIFIGPVLIFSAIGISATVQSNTVTQRLLEMQLIGDALHLASQLLPFLLVIAAFTFVYIFIPNTRVKFKSALIGATVAGILWEMSGWGFALFVGGTTKYTAIYSALATLILFMIWLYVSWLILLIGASIAFYHQHPEHRTIQRGVMRLSNRFKEKLSLILLLKITRRFYQKKSPLSIESVARELDLPMDVVALALNNLQKQGLLERTQQIPAGFIPALPPDELLIADMLYLIRGAGETHHLRTDKLPRIAAIENLQDELQQSLEQQLGQRTLKSLALQVESTQNMSQV